ncbi:hypothetical protein PWT90_07319 [Aphanocladium album]|nr:hypothetical protein PWT90_07319 [Aphanocladium album]
MSEADPSQQPRQPNSGQGPCTADSCTAEACTKPSCKVDVRCYKDEKDHMPVLGEEVEASEAIASSKQSDGDLSEGNDAPAILSATEKDSEDTSSAESDLEDTDVEINIKPLDRTNVSLQKSNALAESTDHASLTSQGTVSTAVAPQRMPRDLGSSATEGSTDDKDDLPDIKRTAGADRGRNSSAPSVAALVSKFRRMGQSPEQDQHTDGTQEQEQASVGSNSKFIQSYRQRSEDSDNEDSLLSAVSSDNANEARSSLVVF